MDGRTETEHARTPAYETVRSPAAVRDHPIHPMIVPLPIGLLSGALAADLLFTGTGREVFAEMALWLVAGGLLTGVLATAAGLVDFVVLERPRRLRAGWVHAIGNGAALVLAAASLAVRLTLGAVDAVLPWGLVLSILTAGLLALTSWYGGELSYRYLVGVRPHPELTADDGHTRLE